MTAYEVTYWIAAIILLYRMIHNLIIFWQNRNCEFLLYFAFSQFFFALYLLFALQTINTEPAAALLPERLENACLPLVVSFFLLFVQKFRPIFSSRILYALLFLSAIFTLIILFYPNAYKLELAAPKTFPLLGVTFYETEQPIWVVMYLLLMMILMAWVLIRYIYFDSLHLTGSRALIISLIFLTITGTMDILVSLRIVYSPYTAHFGILFVMFAVESLFGVVIKFNPDQLMRRMESDQESAAADENEPEKTPALSGASEIKTETSTTPAATFGSAAVASPEVGKADTSAEGGGEIKVRITCLGPLDIYSGGKMIPFTQISRKKKLLKLFKMLLLKYGKWLHKEAVLEALWPELPEKGALNNLHALCFRMRKIFGHPDALIFAEDRLFLNRHVVQVDFVAFEKLLDRARDFYLNKDYDNAIALYQEAEGLYRGNFFDFDPYFEGAELIRENLRLRYKKSLIRLCEMFREQKHFQEMVEYSQKAVQLDELDEEVWRLHFQALNDAGRKNEALKKYERLKKVLKKEVDVDPDEVTVHMIDAIRSGEKPAGPVKNDNT